jgi:hypothetical protein
MGIKIRRSPEDFRGYLVFLEGGTGMLDGLISEVPEKLAKRLRPVKSMAVNQLLNFKKSRFNGGYVTCYTHLTQVNKVLYLLSSQQLSDL